MIMHLVSKYTINNKFVHKNLASKSLDFKNMSQHIIHHSQGRQRAD
jgi:hypothetical protein